MKHDLLPSGKEETVKLGNVFSFRLGEADLQRLARVAAHLGRSKGDAIRYLVRAAYGQLPNEAAAGAAPAGGEAADE